MSLTKQKLEDFQRELIQRRAELSAEVRATTAEIIDDDALFADSVDQAAADTGRSVQVQIQNRERGILAEIDAALKRIESGRFGVCDNCGDEIGEARIKANPAATLCIDCKAELESEQGRFPRRA